MTLAAEDARSKAEAIAKAMGVQIIGRPRDDGGLEEEPIPADLSFAPTPDVPLLAPFRVKVEMLRAARGAG